MRVLTLTDINKPIELVNEITGTVALRELYIWPGWFKPKTNVLFSYNLKSKGRGSLELVLVEQGKTYTFSDIQNLIRQHLDRDSDNSVNIFYNAGRVTLMVDVKMDPKFNIGSISFSDELLEMLKLPKKQDYQGITPGMLVEESDIRLTLSDAGLLYFKCAQVDDTTTYENNMRSDIIAIVPLEFSTSNDKMIRYHDSKPLFFNLDPHQTHFKLKFSITDEQGVELPIHKVVCSILNK